MKPLGYIVMEASDDYEQALVLRTGAGLPPGGVLDWSSREPRAVFSSRKAARDAIVRTEHYRLAFGLTSGPKALPEKALCRVVPVRFIDEETA